MEAVPGGTDTQCPFFIRERYKNPDYFVYGKKLESLKDIEPIFRPQGFDWKLDVSLIAGVGAKEIVASTMGVLYADDEEVADENADNKSERYANLRQKMEADGITPLIAFAYLLFVLIYFPCIATIAAIKGETGSWKWALFAACYTTALAWVVSAVVYQVGSIF